MDISRNITLLSNAFNSRNSKQFKTEFALPFSVLPLSFTEDSRMVLKQTQENIQKVNLNVLCNNKFNDGNLAAATCARYEVIIALLANDPPRGTLNTFLHRFLSICIQLTFVN